MVEVGKISLEVHGFLNLEKLYGRITRELKNKITDNSKLKKIGETESCKGLNPTACITTISLSERKR